METATGPSDNHWHLDKKIPISIILALMIQTATGVAWIVNVSNRLEKLEETDRQRVGHGDRILILEQSIGYIRSDLSEIKALLKVRVDNSFANPQRDALK